MPSPFLLSFLAYTACAVAASGSPNGAAAAATTKPPNRFRLANAKFGDRAASARPLPRPVPDLQTALPLPFRICILKTAATAAAVPDLLQTIREDGVAGTGSLQTIREDGDYEPALQRAAHGSGSPESSGRTAAGPRALAPAWVPPAGGWRARAAGSSSGDRNPTPIPAGRPGGLTPFRELVQLRRRGVDVEQDVVDPPARAETGSGAADQKTSALRAENGTSQVVFRSTKAFQTQFSDAEGPQPLQSAASAAPWKQSELLTLHGLAGGRYTVPVHPDSTVADVKREIQTKYPDLTAEGEDWKPETILEIQISSGTIVLREEENVGECHSEYDLQVWVVSVELEQEYTDPARLMCALWQTREPSRRLDRFWGSATEKNQFFRHARGGLYNRMVAYCRDTTGRGRLKSAMKSWIKKWRRGSQLTAGTVKEMWKRGHYWHYNGQFRR